MRKHALLRTRSQRHNEWKSRRHARHGDKLPVVACGCHKANWHRWAAAVIILLWCKRAFVYVQVVAQILVHRLRLESLHPSKTTSSPSESDHELHCQNLLVVIVFLAKPRLTSHSRPRQYRPALAHRLRPLSSLLSSHLLSGLRTLGNPTGTARGVIDHPTSLASMWPVNWSKK